MKFARTIVAFGLTVVCTLLLAASPAACRSPNSRILSENYRLFHKDEVLPAAVMNLWPTQARIGEREVRKKLKKIKKMDRDQRKEFLRENLIPVVVGTGGRLYVVDHHHLVRAVYEAGHSHLYVKIIANWSKYNVRAFWQKMIANHFVYLFDDVTGRELSPEQLPQSIPEMGNDIYRAIAGLLRDKGYFEKRQGEYFIEFVWARALRAHFDRIGFNPEREPFHKVMKEAKQFAVSQVALHSLQSSNDCPAKLKSHD